MILDMKFVFIALSIITIFVIPLYIYRERILTFFYKHDDFKTFLEEVKVYLKNHHPKISFNFEFLRAITEEPNPKTKEVLVVENLVSQFIEYNYQPTTQASLSNEKLWENYQQNSKPIKSKLPNDWSRRKDLTWQRDDKRCKRCGIKLKMDEAQIHFIRAIEDGGTYHFENLLTLCNDCNKILNNENKLKAPKYLNILDILMNKVMN